MNCPNVMLAKVTVGMPDSLAPNLWLQGTAGNPQRKEKFLLHDP